jgi:hypothetical protein
MSGAVVLAMVKRRAGRVAASRRRRNPLPATVPSAVRHSDDHLAVIKVCGSSFAVRCAHEGANPGAAYEIEIVMFNLLVRMV